MLHTFGSSSGGRALRAACRPIALQPHAAALAACAHVAWQLCLPNMLPLSHAWYCYIWLVTMNIKASVHRRCEPSGLRALREGYAAKLPPTHARHRQCSLPTCQTFARQSGKP